VTATGGFAKSDGLDRAPPARQTRDQVGPEEVRRPEPSADTCFVARLSRNCFGRGRQL
jgi:hypothetical protein